MYLQAELQTVTNNAAPGRDVTFTVGSGKAAQSCSAQTNGKGIATCVFSKVLIHDGSQPLTIVFAGDAGSEKLYIASKAATTVRVTG